MTPTLYGRWQTRLLLFATIGALVTIPFVLGRSGPDMQQYFAVLVWLAVLGLGWDLVYDLLQKRRWDRDWPAIFQLIAGCWEAMFILILINGLSLPLWGVASSLDLAVFLPHYSAVWLSIFVTSQSWMRIIFPRWRFNGGQWF